MWEGEGEGEKGGTFEKGMIFCHQQGKAGKGKRRKGITLYVFMCVCVCVCAWGGGGGGLLSLKSNYPNFGGLRPLKSENPVIADYQQSAWIVLYYANSLLHLLRQSS